MLHIDMMPSTPVRCALIRRPTTPTNKSPLKSNQGTGKYAFTPKQSSKRIPRAWERKPSTPFAPRTEFHKIWKRCEVPAVNEQTSKENPGEDEGKERSNLRAVKKRRVGQRDTNESATTKVEKSRYVRRRKKVTVADAYSPRVTKLSDNGPVAETPEIPDDEETVPDQMIVGEKEEVALPPLESSAGFDMDHEAEPRPSTCPEANVELSRATPTIALPVPSEEDDTEYLHAFLTRAKASKSQQTVLNPAVNFSFIDDTAATSPQRTPRSSKSKSGKSQRSPDKSERQEKVTTFTTSEEQASPLRKSTRTRLRFQPSHNLANPSSIPLRRSNGTEFVFLQNTEAQQIAMATRSNTRKNKGEALIPKRKIELLSSQTQSSPEKVINRGTKLKQVSWVEGLLQGESDVACDLASGIVHEGVETTKPARRSQRSRSGNGTPAPKKYMMEASAIDEPETPSAKSRKSTRSKA